MTDASRPDPEVFLPEANAEAAADAPQRGRLKIFLGASPGVGKTYAMLEEAAARRRAGVDVVAALVETHGRAETAALLARLDQIPRREISYRDRRLHEGKVYMPAEAGRALANFSKPNLTALRELALRTAASRVDADMLALTRGAGRPAAQDRLMVCLDDPASAKGLVRAGRRMTDRARIPWVVAHVLTPALEARAGAEAGTMTDALQLAERLGAETRTLRAETDPAGAFLDAARQLNVTRLIVGRPALAGPAEGMVPGLAQRAADQRGGGVRGHGPETPGRAHGRHARAVRRSVRADLAAHRHRVHRCGGALHADRLAVLASAAGRLAGGHLSGRRAGGGDAAGRRRRRRGQHRLLSRL